MSSVTAPSSLAASALGRAAHQQRDDVRQCRVGTLGDRADRDLDDRAQVAPAFPRRVTVRLMAVVEAKLLTQDATHLLVGARGWAGTVSSRPSGAAGGFAAAPRRTSSA